MKILLMQDYLRSGGTERQSVLLANAFAAAGHVSTLLTFRPGGPLEPTVAPNVQLRALQQTDRGLDWLAPGLSGVVHAAAPDVVLAMGRMANCYAGSVPTSVPAAPSTPTTIATMRTGKPLPWLYRRSLRRVAHVVANSHDASAALQQIYGVAAEKISVIHNSLVFAAANEAPSADAVVLRTQHGARPSTAIYLCVAMFRPEKNQRELIETAAALPRTADWQLWFAGDGPARRACEELVTAKNLGDRVKFMGFHRDPSTLYSAADVAVHASSSEALSNFLIEAQAHGLVAVAYEAQGIRECFIPDRTGWAIRRNDRAAFIAALLQLAAETPDARQRRSDEARVFARAAFDPARQVAAYLDLFQRLRHRG